MKLVVSTKAQREIRDATVWYEEQTRGLSAEFLRAIELNLGYVQRNPLLFAETLPGLRRIALRRFPYSLFYRIRDEKITVLACLHQHRDPQDWHTTEFDYREAKWVTYSSF